MNIRPASTGDVKSIRQIAERAYVRYIPRIGRPPAPMLADFQKHVARNEVVVVEEAEQIVGFLVSYPVDDVYFIENIAVDPVRARKGVGYRLMLFAEKAAIEAEKSRLRLYTNVRMWENFAFYARLGYHKIKVVKEASFRRIYFEKELES